MPFTASSFGALVQGNGFTLWHYRTTDARAVVTAAGYFSAIADSLQPGDLMILQAADSLALLPIRSGPAFGTGVTLHGVVGPLSLFRSVAHGITIGQAASAVVRTIVLAPLAAAVLAGSTIPASASVSGPVAQVVFSLRDRDDVVIPPLRTAAVSNGAASTSFPAPPVGAGYRIRVEDAADPSIGMTSRSFSVGQALNLLAQEDGTFLLLEQGSGALRR